MIRLIKNILGKTIKFIYRITYKLIPCLLYTSNDQKRVTTPAMAKELTSSYIVVGRTITGSQDPLATYKKVYQDFQGE